MYISKNIIKRYNKMKEKFIPKELRGFGKRKYSLEHQQVASFSGIHWHDCVEIIYIFTGQIQIFFEDRWRWLHAGDLIVIPPRQIHGFLCTDANTVKDVLAFTKEVLCDHSDYEGEAEYLLPRGRRLSEQCIFNGVSDWEEIFGRMEKIYEEDAVSSSLMMQGEILKLYANILRALREKGFLKALGYDHSLVRKIRTILEENFRTPPSAAELAAIFNISYSNMSKLLRANLGYTYGELLLEARVEQAKKLLLTSDKSITEIGYECGFCDSSYFIKMFRKCVGVTPRQYRTIGMI